MAGKTWQIAGINFDHMHMGDLLRMVTAHGRAEISGIWHREINAQVKYVIDALKIPQEKVYTSWEKCLEQSKPDLVVLCPSTAQHGEWVEKVAPYGTHVFVEKPFAATLGEADRMIAAMKKTGKQLIINWPLRWYASHVTAKRLCDEGRIGPVIEVHYYDGNRGPVRHMADKVELEDIPAADKAKSWWYQKSAGGGSLLDYLGYGVTLGTWYHSGKAPREVTCTVDEPHGLEVDEHSVTVCRYDTGLSKFETRWGTFTDPWMIQPQPKCGFVIVGRDGTIASYDYENTIFVQDRGNPKGYSVPVDKLEAPLDNPINYVLDRLETNRPIEGPLSPAMCRIGQQIVDSAARSAAEKRTVALAR
jgi:glucose-fructose oxidoreductase